MNDGRLFLHIGMGLLAWALAGGVAAQPCEELPPVRAVSDRAGGCLALVPIGDPRMGAATLVVLLHGDGRGTLDQRQVDRWHDIGRTLARPDRNVFFMVRPGYHSPAGDSSGWANPRDDDYTPGNIDRVAGALRALRQSYRPDQVILVGHSGGAATSALLLGRHPGLADAALLLGCPCDLPPWRDHRNAQRGGGAPWTSSLNPLDFVGGIPASTPVAVVTGSQDDNTLPEFGRRWAELAAARGVKARFEDATGFTHATIQQWPAIPRRVDALLDDLSH